jgi:hypothetical protein
MNLGEILIDSKKVIDLLHVASAAVELAHGRPIAIANGIINAVDQELQAHAAKVNAEADKSAPPA